LLSAVSAAAVGIGASLAELPQLHWLAATLVLIAFDMFWWVGAGPLLPEG
jgi:hypothetical protein